MPDNSENPQDPSPYSLLSTREVYRNPWISVREDQVTRSDGSNGLFGIITMKPGSTVLAVTDDQQIFLTKEFKYGIQRTSLELASGAIEAGETPLDAARRELQEELGLTANRWIDCGRIDPFTTVVSSPNYMFLALELKHGSQNLDPGEVLSMIKMPLAEAVEMVMQGKITHGASCVLILKAQRILSQQAKH